MSVSHKKADDLWPPKGMARDAQWSDPVGDARPSERVPDSEEARLREMMRFEAHARRLGHHRVAGVDEAGRGPLAGPIVAAAVILSCAIPGLDDSKRLSPSQRESLFIQLHRGRHTIGVAILDAESIDMTGIQRANHEAMLQAAAQLEPPPDYLLVDGFNLPRCPFPHQRIIKGDQLSLSIAAASIVAKVVRDRIMIELDEQYPQYGFRRHKGYGTAEHMAALRAHGPCPVHRRSFAPMSACTPPLELPFIRTKPGD